MSEAAVGDAPQGIGLSELVSALSYALDIGSAVIELSPPDERREIDDDYLDDIAAAFAKVVDAKSPFTRGHSDRVALFTDRLDEAEWAAIRHHPSLGEIILSRIGAFQELSRIAGAHDERLDGKGYPRGLHAADIDLGTRIVTTADIFDALSADRPYRPAMPVSTALEVMAKDVGTAIDPACFDALKRALAAWGEQLDSQKVA